jgi:hypothetical protein
VIKPLSIALALGLAAAGTAALAGDPGSSMTGTPLQNCVAKEKAKNDGRTDADINAACTAKMQKQQTPSTSTDSMAPGNGPAPSTTTPPPSSYPTTTPDDTSQDPK